MTKKKKIILIISLSAASAVVTYFGGGLIVTNIAIENMINVRGSNYDTLRDSAYRLDYNRFDYPALADREEISFKCNGATLQGYYYKAEDSKGVVMTAHGVNSMADASMSAIQNYFVNKGWSVFSFDMVGCGRSGGKGMKSLHESRPCINAALKAYKEKVSDNKDEKLCLIGHSWGAYGSLTASGFDAVAAFSGFNKPSEMMYCFAETHTSPALIVTKPGLDFSLALRYGNEEFKTASGSVKKNKDTKYMIIQGDKDYTVPLKKYSAYANIDENKCKNATKVLLEGVGHSAPWKSLAAQQYTEELEMKLNKLHEQYGKDIPDNVLQEFFATVNKEKSSELNEPLLDKIEEMFLNS